MNLERLEFIDKQKAQKLKKINVMIIGIGGVGGYTLESLARSGVKNITIVDKDIIEESNINRQLICLNSTIGLDKCDAWKSRLKDINKDININIINKKVCLEDIKEIINEYDYIIDTCDDVKLKIDLIEYAVNNKINIISSMGMANKVEASKIKVTTLDKTNYDKLAKKLRSELKKRKVNIKKVNVVSSTEEVKPSKVLGSTSFVPAVAGLLITNIIYKNL